MEKKHSVSKEIAASPTKVWELITDLPSMGRWSPENDGGKWVKGSKGAETSTLSASEPLAAAFDRKSSAST